MGGGGNVRRRVSSAPDRGRTSGGGGGAPGVDVQVPLRSLPARLGSVVDTVPEETP